MTVIDLRLGRITNIVPRFRVITAIDRGAPGIAVDPPARVCG
jgi:hypothetical protein